MFLEEQVLRTDTGHHLQAKQRGLRRHSLSELDFGLQPPGLETINP